MKAMILMVSKTNLLLQELNGKISSTLTTATNRLLAGGEPLLSECEEWCNRFPHLRLANENSKYGCGIYGMCPIYTL